MSGFDTTKPIAVYVLNGKLGAISRLFRKWLWTVHGSVNLATQKAYQCFDLFVVVDLGEPPQRTTRRCHTNAWNLLPLDNGYGAVHEV